MWRTSSWIWSWSSCKWTRTIACHCCRCCWKINCWYCLWYPTHFSCPRLHPHHGLWSSWRLGKYPWSSFSGPFLKIVLESYWLFKSLLIGWILALFLNNWKFNAHPKDPSGTTLATNYAVNYWVDGGLPPEKLVFGMPAYGRCFSMGSTSVKDCGKILLFFIFVRIWVNFTPLQARSSGIRFISSWYIHWRSRIHGLLWDLWQDKQQRMDGSIR